MISPAALPRDLAYDLGAIAGVPAVRRDDCLRGLCLDAWDGLYGDPGRALVAQLVIRHRPAGRRRLPWRRHAVGVGSREEVVEEVMHGEARVTLDGLVEAARVWASTDIPTVRYPSGPGQAGG